MNNLTNKLAAIAGNLEESMGVRPAITSHLAPQVQARDAGRRPLRGFGRIAIDQIVPDPDQPRAEFTEEALERLARSIREKGQLTPIRVRWSDELGKWVIVFGERRWRAARRAGLVEIECFFHETDLDDGEILEQQLVENCLREDLLPIEEARAFARLMDLKGWNGKQLADALRVSQSRVSRSLALLRLPEPIREQVDRGEIPARAAYEISRIENDDVRMNLAEGVTRQGLTVAKTARQVRQRQGKTRPDARHTKQTFFSENGWMVVVTGPGRGTYYDIEKALSDALDEVRHRIDCRRTL